MHGPCAAGLNLSDSAILNNKLEEHRYERYDNGADETTTGDYLNPQPGDRLKAQDLIQRTERKTMATMIFLATWGSWLTCSGLVTLIARCCIVQLCERKKGGCVFVPKRLRLEN